VPIGKQDGEQTLPRFWIEFRPCRKNASAARLFLEHYRVTHFRGEFGYDFTFSSSLIKDLMGLNFHGGDDRCSWASRAKGVSLFSLAPASETGLVSSARDAMMSFEDTADQHTPADRLAMAALSDPDHTIPTNRSELYQWIDHARWMLDLLFSEDCPLVPLLATMIDLLKVTHRFSTFEPLTFMALLWRLHRGVRMFFTREGSIEPLRRTIKDIQQMVRPSTEDLPSELRKLALASKGATGGGGPTSGTSSGTARSHGSSGTTGPSPKKARTESQGFTRRLDDSNDFVSEWAADIDRASAAMPASLEFGAASLARDQAERKALFGPEFCALADNQNPCVRHFICGKCNSGPRCKQAHTLTARPTRNVLNGLKARIQRRVEDICKDPKAFGRAPVQGK
jgi:hypothetical protein